MGTQEGSGAKLMRLWILPDRCPHAGQLPDQDAGPAKMIGAYAFDSMRLIIRPKARARYRCPWQRCPSGEPFTVAPDCINTEQEPLFGRRSSHQENPSSAPNFRQRVTRVSAPDWSIRGRATWQNGSGRKSPAQRDGG